MNNTDILASITPEQIIDLRDWASDCLGMVGETATIDHALNYVRANYPGGWAAFVSEVCTERPAVVEVVSNWRPDDCWDPCHSEAVIRFNGELYRAHRTLGEGWPFTVHPARYDGRSWTVVSFAEFAAMLAG